MQTTASLAHAPSRSKALHVALWVVQALLAANYGIAGVMKSTMPIADLAQKLVWPGALPVPLVRFIGVAELAAALGLILPSVTRIRPVLTPIAAAGLTVIMLLATAFHVSRGETQMLPVTLTFAALAAFVAWGRGKKAPIAAR
jgi:putative oxidoreductase